MPSFSLALASDGPVVEVLVSLTASRRYVLSRFKLPVPEPVRVRALIDTGATYSCFDPAVFSRLDLAPSYEISLLTPATGAVPQQMKQYEVEVEVVSPTHERIMPFQRVTAVEASLAAQGIQGLLGRDILNRCLFTYDGPKASFSLTL